MVNRYFTWTPKKISDNDYKHPNTDFPRFPDDVTITETKYYHTPASGLVDERIYLGILTYPAGWFSTVNLDRLKAVLDSFNVTPRTPIEVINYLNNAYLAPEGEADYFVLDNDNFTIIDNRPVVEVIN